MKVAKWGNSLAVRIPNELVTELGLHEGDDVVLRPVQGNIVEIARIARREEALAALAKFRGMRPRDYVFDRDEANAR